jgi:hypothetical protein
MAGYTICISTGVIEGNGAVVWNSSGCIPGSPAINDFLSRLSEFSEEM